MKSSHVISLSIAVMLAVLGWTAWKWWSSRVTLPSLVRLVRTRFPEVPTISTIELDAWLKEREKPAPLLLDVRPREEYEPGHLAGAVQVNPGKPSPEWLRTLSTQRSIVVYCSVGYRSAEFARHLRDAGFTNVFNLEGSIFQWSNEGRPFESSALPQPRIHPYAKEYQHLVRPEVRFELEPGATK